MKHPCAIAALRVRGLAADGRNSAAPQAADGNDFLVWQLIDSAFPTGGFAHSFGLEAAWQHGQVRNGGDLTAFAEASLQQAGQAALPFVNAAFAEPAKLPKLDRLCDAFTTNHVANRASRAQGQAFLIALERVFGLALPNGTSRPPFFHFAPAFGAGLRSLDLAWPTVGRMFFFNHLRGVLAAAMRLNIVGPMEAHQLQRRLAPAAELARQKCSALSLDDLAQTAPLLDLWQGAQDRLYSRLFQS